MDRRTFISSITFGLVALPLAAEAQAPKVYRVGYIGTTPPPPHMWEPFLQELRVRGWVEGQNIVFDRRFSEGHTERFPAFAVELVRLKVDMILTAGGPAQARAAKSATTVLPIVFVTAGDPVAEGLVSNLARPGGNMTGLALVVDIGAMHAKRLELLKEVAPKVSQVAVIYSTRGDADIAFSQLFKPMEAAARALQVTLLPALVDTPAQFTDAFANVTRQRGDGLVAADSGLNYLYRHLIVDFAARRRLPAVYSFRESVEAGGLMAYGASLPENFRRAATYVDKILRGAKPGDLPIEQPEKFELVVNLRTAKALGLTIPESVRVRADEIIQ